MLMAMRGCSCTSEFSETSSINSASLIFEGDFGFEVEAFSFGVLA